jgi:hypothetical protein
VKPKRIAKPFVHQPFIGGFNGFPGDKHDVVQFGIAAGRPSAEINRKKLFSSLASHIQKTPGVSLMKASGKNNSSSNSAHASLYVSKYNA